MSFPRVRFSSAVATLVALSAFFLPARMSALQLYARAGRAGSNAVAARTDSLLTAASASGGPSSDSVSTTDKKDVPASSGDKGSGLSGKVFARFVMPEDWISLASLPGSTVTNASIQGTATNAETVFTMRSFGQKVRAWLNGYRLGYWPAEKGRLRS